MKKVLLVLAAVMLMSCDIIGSTKEKSESESEKIWSVDTLIGTVWTSEEFYTLYFYGNTSGTVSSSFSQSVRISSSSISTGYENTGSFRLYDGRIIIKAEGRYYTAPTPDNDDEDEDGNSGQNTNTRVEIEASGIIKGDTITFDTIITKPDTITGIISNVYLHK